MKLRNLLMGMAIAVENVDGAEMKHLPSAGLHP